MNRAEPIPDSIERRPGGIERASCVHDGRKISRTIAPRELSWWHVETMLIHCAEGK